MFLASKHLSEHASKYLATLSKALESASTNLSTNLSIVAVLGLALVPLLPLHAASTSPRPASLVLAKAAPAPEAPIELVRAKPILVPDQPALPGPALQDAPAAERAMQVAVRYWRGRQRRQQQRPLELSGDLGKSAANTKVEKTPVAPPESKSGVANAEPPEPDEWSDAEIITALKDCLKRLAPLGAEIEIAPPVRQEQCGAPAPVMLKRMGSGATRVDFQPPPMLNCAMVVSLHTWIEKTLQPAAQEVLGSPIVRLRGTSGYACRNRNGSRTHSDRLSEHALANAIDIMGFVTADGRTIDVATKWGPTARDIREQQERAAEAQRERAAEAKKERAAETQKERPAEGKAVAKKSDKEVLDAARDAAKQALKEAAEAERAAAKAPRNQRKQAQAEAQRKREEAERKADEVERLGEEAERRATEVRRESPRTAGLQKLGKGVDPKADAQKANPKATPTTAAPSDTPRPAAEAAFLRRLHKGACTAFGTVLGPEANEAHRDHFHFDLAPRKRSAFCE